MKTFTQLENELGHRIVVRAESKPISGFPGILLTIEGPTTKIESHVTRKEAEAIRTVLTNIED